MRFTSESNSDGVVERLFTVDDIPGVMWSPADAPEEHPLVLIGHGGGQHKKAPGVVARARSYVCHGGLTAVAIDAPAHGDRQKTEADEQHQIAVRQLIAAGEPAFEQIVRYNAIIAERAVSEWQAVLDALEVGAALPVGYWGVSMGAAIGVALAATEPRITAAVLGLIGNDALAAQAARVTIPVEFLLQWDDELVPRALGLALFDAFASQEKTLHANPGRHQNVPTFEIESSQRFFARHLLKS